MVEYTESVSGFKVIGSWDEIVEHGERVGFALEQIEINEYGFESEYDDYNEWRPKVDEFMRKDVSKKTAEKASMNKSETEKETTKKTEFQKARESSSDQQSVKSLINVLRLLARESVRKSEETVYGNVMTKLSPQYFDNELVSANLARIEQGKYQLEININDDSLKESVRKKLQEHQEEYERWHIKSRYNKESIEQVEGVETQENASREDVDPTNR